MSTARALRQETSFSTWDSHFYDISADGRYVAFDSFASDLVTNDFNGTVQDVFVRDMVAHVTTMVSVSSDGTSGGNGQSVGPSLSADGRYVVFASKASNLVSGVTSSGLELFVRDLQLGTTAMVTINQDGTGGGGLHTSFAFSADGRVVAFDSAASNLVPNDTNNDTDLFVRDLEAGTTTLISVAPSGAGGGRSGPRTFDNIMLNADGRFVAFSSPANFLVANENNTTGVENAFVSDVIGGTTTLLSVNQSGTGGGDDFSFARSISADGRFVTFDSRAGDLVANDANGINDAFVRDQVTGTTMLLSANLAGTGTGGGLGDSVFPEVSADGSTIAFSSDAHDLLATDTGKLNVVYAAHLQTASTAVVTIVDASGSLQFGQTAFSVAKDGGSITITVTRSGGSAGGVTVDYATSDGTAKAGIDYTATAGTLTFGAGETSRSFTVPILNDGLRHRRQDCLSDPR